ncbi:uncharacterized protein [Drosophila pseudoobscura]|uniref:Uncharacterized protein n=1 Tax=Drosophila pseudoobscura pseudoobscura TaxID=46245 RepID=Q29EL2_DROPS|nr:uncharacterized protein LOC4812121 [Drosophila pseudoobscura]
MFKILFVLCAVYAALSQARPSYLHGYDALEYAPSVVGYESLALPAAVSHQSSTVVHEKRPYWRPIVDHHSPLLRASYAPVSSISYAPLGYAAGSAGWYEPGAGVGAWGGSLGGAYESIYLK